MRPNLCETCILQAACTESCNEHAIERMNLSYQLNKIHGYIFSKNSIPRKHIKTQQLKHYTALTKKWLKNISQASDIRDRRFFKDGKILLYGSFKGVMSGAYPMRIVLKNPPYK